MDIKAIDKNVMQIDLQRNEQPPESPKTANSKSPEISTPVTNNISLPGIEPALQTKAVFAVDQDKNVNIQIIDEDGKVVRQIPAAEYREMAKKLSEVVKSLYDKWV